MNKFFLGLVTIFLVSCEEEWKGIIYYDKNDLSNYKILSQTYESEDECLVYTENELDRRGIRLKGDLECFKSD